MSSTSIVVSPTPIPAQKRIPVTRKDFTETTKKFTKMDQGFVCKDCKKPPKFWEFHHIDGNRSNNKPSNCEGLCRDCHAEKTWKKNT